MSLLMMFLGIYMALFRIKMPTSLAYIFKEIYTFVCYTISKHKFQYIEKKKPHMYMNLNREKLLWHIMTFLLIDFELPVHSYKPRYHSSRGRGEGVVVLELHSGRKHILWIMISTCFVSNNVETIIYEKQICWVGVSGLKQLKEMIYMPTRADTC